MEKWTEIVNDIKNSISPEFIATYAKHPIKQVRMEVAQNLFVSSETLDLMVDDESPMVQYKIAKNKNASPAALCKLVDNENSFISNAALENPNLPMDVKCAKQMELMHKEPKSDWDWGRI